MKGEQCESVGEEMMLVLSVLGQILVELADAQVSMFQILEALLSLLLEAFAGVDWEDISARAHLREVRRVHGRGNQ